MLEHDHKPGGEEPTGADGALGQAQESQGILVTRRTALVAGGVGVGGLILGGGLAVGVPAADAALPTTTAPEQLRLEFGNDPKTEMTVSWSAPGTVPMPAPTLAYSTRPISARNRGKVIALPQSTPLDLTRGPRRGPSSTSFLDGQTRQTTYHYHVPLKGLRPDTTYYYEVCDGAGSTASAQFRTAPRGRASFRFTAFGDQGVNPPSPGTTAGVIKPGDGAGAPLFHLMVGDLAYANTTNPPSVWRPWALMTAPAASTFPWMPVPGNHELETGTTDISGRTSGVYNGPYGLGNYMARYLLPENGLSNWDGNTLQGNFYSFQIGTVLFVNLYGNDVIWQTSDFSSPHVTQYTGDLKAEPGTTNLVPDHSGGTPNLQLEWLERTLSEARRPGSGVEMIVVQFHFPFASVDTGNSCDMGLRASRPGFRGTPVVGGTLVAIAGPWSPHPTLRYQWLQDGVPIDGATEETLVVPAACAGKEVTLQVTAERTGYVTRETISDAVAIGFGTIESSMPRIEGDPRVDATLQVIKGEWSAQAEFHYQWIVGGVARDGRSTGPAYKVRPEDHGQRVTVEVTGRMNGSEPVVRSSAATEPVRRA